MRRLLLIVVALVLTGCKPGVYASFQPGTSVGASDQPAAQAQLVPPQPSK